MAPDAVKCLNCESTQIDGYAKGGGTSSSLGMVTEQGAVPMIHSTTDATYYCICKACGYEWDPQAVAAEEYAREQAEAKAQELAAIKAIFNSWREKLLEKLNPILSNEKDAFSEWLEEGDLSGVAYFGKGEYELDAAIEGDNFNEHPWLRYHLHKKFWPKMHSWVLPCYFTPGITVLCVLALTASDTDLDSSEVARNRLLFLVPLVHIIVTVGVMRWLYTDVKRSAVHQLESIYQPDGSQQIDIAPTRGRRQRQRAPSEEATTGSSKSSPRRSPTLFFVKKKGHAARRLSSSELRTAVGNREFAPDDRIRKSKKDTWTLLSEVKGLDFPKPS